jgi:tetratricopeptide (TPR) repeat protein
VLLAASGCATSNQANLTYGRGVQMLAAGSPKSAVPFLSQFIVSVPDGPEPGSMLALAYALDMQPDAAVEQAKRVKSASPEWQTVAIAVAEMLQHRPDEAVTLLETVIAAAPKNSSLRFSASQWLTLALLLKGDHASAAGCLDSAVGDDRATGAHTTALLWSVLIHGRRVETEQAMKDLQAAANETLGSHGPDFLATVAPSKLTDSDLCDAGIAAIGRGQLDRAEELMTALNERSPNGQDAEVWLALIAAAKGDWARTRDMLKDGCERGPICSRSIANHLFSVICAIEGRPDNMIQSILCGQRLYATHHFPLRLPPEAKPETVWMSDRLK